MTDKQKELVREWLSDAHAMEAHAEQLFSKQAERFKNYAALQSKLKSDLNRIVENQVALSIRMQQLGSSSSIIKDAAAKVFAGVQNMSVLAVSDEPVKGILAIHTFTQLAIGSYNILVTAADAIGDEETKTLCQTLLDQVQVRAHWISEELGSITRTYILETSE
ncbi:MAG: DUF892 family protein [Cellvibrio sp.]|uniref:DUF892 family protein n=1 Tax=Cellvibrio sp. TaxID=1965322 RepID=UPI0031AA7444